MSPEGVLASRALETPANPRPCFRFPACNSQSESPAPVCAETEHPVSCEFRVSTDRGRPRDKDSVRERILVPVVNRANEIRAERGISPLPKITPHALRRTYISLMLEAGTPLPYVMDQVGHADSRTTLEIYAQVQKRVSRKNVHAAFDDLLNGANRATVRSLF